MTVEKAGESPSASASARAVTKGLKTSFLFGCFISRGRLEQMDGSTRNILVLPNELIANILAMLHYRDLASSIQVHIPVSFPSYFYD
jgi:hypothetical protein